VLSLFRYWLAPIRIRTCRESILQPARLFVISGGPRAPAGLPRHAAVDHEHYPEPGFTASPADFMTSWLRPPDTLMA